MRHSTKTLLVVLITAMSFLAVQTAWAERPDPSELGLIVTGEISEIDREISTITIEGIEIKGFPFGYLEKEMEFWFGEDFVIEEGDCAEVEYAIVDCSEGIKNIAVALIRYSVKINENECEDWINFNIVLRDENFYPVDKSPYGDDSDRSHHRNNDGND